MWGAARPLGIGGTFGNIFGLGLKSSLLYTWGSTWGNVETDQLYAGGEGILMISGLNLCFGLYSRVDGDHPEKDMLVSVGAGLGF